jgi:hypothetical protein
VIDRRPAQCRAVFAVRYLITALVLDWTLFSAYARIDWPSIILELQPRLMRAWCLRHCSNLDLTRWPE